MNDTKKKILDISLELFSQKGFSAVSIRDICKQVEIKESSVYYHFKNKQAILDELLSQFQDTAKGMMMRLDKELANSSAAPSANFYDKICNCFFENYFLDSFCNRVMRLLLIEQLCNDEVEKIYNRWMFQEPLSFQSKIFSMLMELGAIKKTDSEYLAIKYYAPIFFFVQRWLLSGELTEERKKAFRTDAYKHIQTFFSELEVA